MVNVGGSNGAGIVGIDAADGAVLWTATDDDASYSAPVVADSGRARNRGCFSPARGSSRSTREPARPSLASPGARAPAPRSTPPRHSSSTAASSCRPATAPAPRCSTWARPRFGRSGPRTRPLTNHYATSVYAAGYLYGYHGRQEYSPAFRAVEAATGEPAWSEERFGGQHRDTRPEAQLLILREARRAHSRRGHPGGISAAGPLPDPRRHRTRLPGPGRRNALRPPTNASL